jgi:hypothetical protein
VKRVVMNYVYYAVLCVGASSVSKVTGYRGNDRGSILSNGGMGGAHRT